MGLLGYWVIGLLGYWVIGLLGYWECRGKELQRQAYDHVLQEEELARDAFESIAHYIAQNPVRAELVSTASDWPFAGTVLPGYPDLDVRREGDWERYWRNWMGL